MLLPLFLVCYTIRIFHEIRGGKVPTVGAKEQELDFTFMLYAPRSSSSVRKAEKGIILRKNFLMGIPSTSWPLYREASSFLSLSLSLPNLVKGGSSEETNT